MERRQGNISPYPTEPTDLDSATPANPLEQQTAKTGDHVAAPDNKDMNTPEGNRFEGVAVEDGKLDDTADEADSNEDDPPHEPWRNKVMVSPDWKKIFDPAMNCIVDMPTEAKEKRAALMKVFFHVTKLLFFHSYRINMTVFFDKVPRELWNCHFTTTRAEAMVNAQETILMEDMGTRYAKVFDEWRKFEGCPMKTPETLEELEEARSTEQSKIRVEWIEELLQPKNERSDRWIRHVYENFADVVALEFTLVEGSHFRKWLTTRLAVMVEGYIEGFVFQKIERELTFELYIRQVSDLAGNLALSSFLSSAPAASGESETSSHSESDNDLDLD